MLDIGMRFTAGRVCVNPDTVEMLKHIPADFRLTHQLFDSAFNIITLQS